MVMVIVTWRAEVGESDSEKRMVRMKMRIHDGGDTQVTLEHIQCAQQQQLEVMQLGLCGGRGEGGVAPAVEATLSMPRCCCSGDQQVVSVHCLQRVAASPKRHTARMLSDPGHDNSCGNT